MHSSVFQCTPPIYRSNPLHSFELFIPRTGNIVCTLSRVCVRFLESPWNSWKIKGVWKILESPGKWPERPGKSWKMKNRNFFKYRDISNTYNPQNFSHAYGAYYNAVKQFKKRASVFQAKKLLLAVHEHNVKKIESCQKLDLGCQSFSHPIFRSVATPLLSYSSIVIWAFFISCTDQTFCHRI